MDIIEDIRNRLCCMPVFAGAGTTISALPAEVSEGTYVYPHPYWFMQAVRNPDEAASYYALRYKGEEWNVMMALRRLGHK